MYKKIFQLLLFSMVVVLIGGGIALLLQPHPAGQADGVSVVGLPSLPASTVNAIFARLGSPMVGTGKVVEQASRQTKIDDAFALAVWWVETSDGEAGVGRANGDRNPGSVRGSIGYPSGGNGYTIYPSYSAAIVYWFGLIRNYYVNRGLSTVYSISHPYVGTSSSPLWAAKVTRLMLRYRSEAPPPTPTIKPSPTASPYIRRILMKDGRLPRVDTVTSSSNQKRTQAVHASFLSQHPRWTEPGIICFALLALLAVAVWGLRLRRVRQNPVRDNRGKGDRNEAGRGLLYYGEMFNVPTTGALQVHRVGAAPYNRAGGERNTEAYISRVVLLPALPDKALPSEKTEAVTVHHRGLLSRYREMEH